MPYEKEPAHLFCPDFHGVLANIESPANRQSSIFRIALSPLGEIWFLLTQYPSTEYLY